MRLIDAEFVVALLERPDDLGVSKCTFKRHVVQHISFAVLNCRIDLFFGERC